MESTRREFLKGAGIAALGVGTAGMFGAATAMAEGSGSGSATGSASGSAAGSASGSAAGSGSAAASTEPAYTYATPSFLVKPDPIDSSLITDTKSADFIVIGTGFAGGCVVRSIAEDSTHTVIGIEKQDGAGYITFGNDIGHFNSQFLRDHDVEDVDPVDMYNDWMRRSLNAANPALIMQYCQNCGDNIDWWLSAFDTDVVSELSIAFNPRPEHLLDEMAGYRFVTGTLRAQVDENSKYSLTDLDQMLFTKIEGYDNAELDFNTTACQLLQDDSGKVTGVIAQDADGNYIEYNANIGVVLSAGDFANNAEMRDYYLTHITDCFQEGRSTWSATMSQDGSGIQMGLWAGARMEPRPIACMNGDWCRGTYPEMIWLDPDGDRYCNEYFSDLPFAGKPMARIAHVDTWAIGDANLLNDVQYCISAHDGFEPTEAKLEVLQAQLDGAKGTGSTGFWPIVSGPRGTSQSDTSQPPTMYSADTIEELASYLGFDDDQQANMIAAVKRWNDLCTEGKDEDFGKDPDAMFPIDTPPYYAYRQSAGMVGGIMVTLGGLMTDKHQQALDEQMDRIDGLYATGNCCGRRFGNGYFTQTPGQSVGIAITLGRELGKYLASL